MTHLFEHSLPNYYKTNISSLFSDEKFNLCELLFTDQYICKKLK